MAATSNSTLRTIFIIAGIALVAFLLIGGNLIWGVAVLILLAVMGGGAMLYRKAGPPER
jgi:hypothetical protein